MLHESKRLRMQLMYGCKWFKITTSTRCNSLEVRTLDRGWRAARKLLRTVLTLQCWKKQEGKRMNGDAGLICRNKEPWRFIVKLEGLRSRVFFQFRLWQLKTPVKYENETALEMFSIRSRTHQQAVNSCSSCFPPHTKHLRPGLHLCVSSSSSIALCFSTQRTLPTPAAHSYALS